MKPPSYESIFLRLMESVKLKSLIHLRRLAAAGGGRGTRYEVHRADDTLTHTPNPKPIWRGRWSNGNHRHCRRRPRQRRHDREAAATLAAALAQICITEPEMATSSSSGGDGLSLISLCTLFSLSPSLCSRSRTLLYS